jgi:TPR repeat protein
MKAILRSGVLALAIMALAVPAHAGPFEKGNAAYESKDYATALKFWRPLAKHGDATAQYYLGLMYANGQGVPQDYTEATKWYRKAAEQGHAQAQFYLGHGGGGGLFVRP